MENKPKEEGKPVMVAIYTRKSNEENLDKIGSFSVSSLRDPPSRE